MFSDYRARLIRKFLYDHQASPINRSCPYTPRPKDVIICGYFRTGVTWLQQILHQIRCTGDESYDDIDQVVPYVPAYMERLDIDLNRPQPVGSTDCRFFRCHDCFEDAPMARDGNNAARDGNNADIRYIVIVRDPYDTAWSEARSRYRNIGVDKDYDYYAFTELNSSPSPDKHQFARPVYYPTYWEHLLSWWPHRKRSTVFWLHYEDLEKDLPLCIAELANFINVTLTKEELDRVHEHCTYEYMRENGDKFAGEYLTKVQSGMLAVEPWRPLMGRVTRYDGAKSGQGSLNLNEKTRAKIRWNWRHSIETMTGFKSYSQLYASNSLVARIRSNEQEDGEREESKRKNTLNFL